MASERVRGISQSFGDIATMPLRRMTEDECVPLPHTDPPAAPLTTEIRPLFDAAESHRPEARLTAATVVAEIMREASNISYRRSYRLAKRLLDIAVSAVGLLVCAPLFIVIAIAIRLDSPGPVFFRQQRVGYLGRPFLIFKFRSMRRGVAVRLDGTAHKVQHDLRVTRVGRFLRATSLDELPQLLNVLHGEMSLVGPRPELPEIVAKHYESWQYQRFLAPQGLTGWWQVNGRGLKLCYLHTEEDLHYIAHASFTFDLYILTRTMRAVLRREGAF